MMSKSYEKSLAPHPLLNVEVALALGWKVVDYGGQEAAYCLNKPDGEPLFARMWAAKNEPWFDPNVQYAMPKWSTDIETALTLVDRSELMSFTLKDNGSCWEACFDTGSQDFWGDGDIPAEAICNAYLKWKKGLGR